MKLTIIGGGSVRAPELIPALVRRAARLDLHEVWLMDDHADKLELIGELCQALARQHNAPFELRLTTDARAALTGAQHVITSIRPGLERGRAIDERIALQHGVLGQETTGAGGLAMAMRSVPAILGYARLLAEVGAPGAWLYNFTNPAGLVAQALHDAGMQRVVGICDSANAVQHAISRYLNVPREQVMHRVYGLNHLSWTRSARIDAEPDGSGGEEVLPGLLADETFMRSTHMTIFDSGLVHWQRAFLNEYLHFYYHRDEALRALLSKGETRGEQVQRLTESMLERLQAAESVEERLAVYHEIMGERTATYMAHARRDDSAPSPGETHMAHSDDEGYAGVALGCVEAIATGRPQYTGLNVPNAGTIPGLRDDDIVEVGCWVDADGIRPLPLGDAADIAPDQLLLMQTVKQYERLASQAILQRSRELAVQALTVHPLVASYPLACSLVNAFLDAHRDLVGEWS